MKQNNNPYFSVYIPSYNHKLTIVDTLKSVLNQTFTDFEVVLRDDCSNDNTYDLVKKIHDPRLRVYKNKVNLGYFGNLNLALTDCISDNIFILAGDDLIDKNTLQWYYNAFKEHPKAGAITRPYYWFDKNYKNPVRYKVTTSKKHNLVVTTKSPFDDIILVLSTLDQCSGLCFKRNLTTQKFSSQIWISHAYPWLDIFKNHPVIFLKKYPLAVYIGQSATRTNIYQKSPMIYWKEMIDTIFFEKKYEKFRQQIISQFIATNYIGIIQIRNYGSFKSYIRELFLLIKFKKSNLINPKFWGIFIFTLIIPPIILRKLTDILKRYINKPFINKDIVIDLSQ